MTLERRTPLRRTGPPRRNAGLAPTPPPARRTPLRPMSAKREAERPERAAVRQAVHDRDRVCQGPARAPWIRCWHPAGDPLDVHEIIPRDAWAKGYLVVDNCVLLCRAHHDWATDYPDAAHAVGLHGYSWERPDNEGDTTP